MDAESVSAVGHSLQYFVGGLSLDVSDAGTDLNLFPLQTDIDMHLKTTSGKIALSAGKIELKFLPIY